MTFMSEYLELKQTGCLPLQRSTNSLPEHVHRLSSYFSTLHVYYKEKRKSGDLANKKKHV